MSEETQTSESLDSIDLFAEEIPEEFDTVPTSAEENQPVVPQGEQQTEEGQETEPEGQPAQTMLDIVYNGQSMQLTREQAVQLAQKGMNYDKKLQEIEQLKNSPEKQLLQRLAVQSGLPYEQFLDTFQQQIRQSTVQARASQLMQDGYMDEDTAMRLAAAELDKEELQNQRAVEEQQRQQFRQQLERQQQAEAQRWANFNREIGELVREYPGFEKKYPTLESMPQVMQDAILGGTSIKQAYQQVVIEELRNENAAYKQNQVNKGQSPGSAAGAGTQSSDVFLSSLFGDD